MKTRRTYYQILHVHADAPEEVIRSSYRTLMQKLKMHPDLGGCHENAAAVNEAYGVLTNTVKRAAYDASLKSSNENTTTVNNSDTTAKRKTSKSAKSPQRNFYQTNDAKFCLFCNIRHNKGDNVQPDDVCSRCDSPLFPARKQSVEICGKRTIQRINKEWPLTFYTSWPHIVAHAGRTKNVSLNGMQLITATALEQDHIVKIVSSELYAVAKVVNCQLRPGGFRKQWRYGLELLTLRFNKTQGTFVSVEI